jgi:hypothetical protein
VNPTLVLAEGRVVGYACGVCKSVQTANRTDPSERDLALPMADATECCVCAGCGATGASIGVSRQCAACFLRAMQDSRTRRAESAAAEASSFAESEKHHDAAWVFALDNGLAGKVYLCEEGHGFYNVFARVDPSEDAPSPEAVSETLRRNAGSAVAEVIGRIADDCDAMVERMEKVK